MRKKPPLINLTLEITNRCNLRCLACGIWKEDPKKELSFKKLSAFLNSVCAKHRLDFVSLTGGEPFLHPQIDQIYRKLYLMKRGGQLRNIGIYSNGFDTSRITAFLKRNLRITHGLVLGVSLDGIGKTHNYLRGKDNAYKRSMKSIDKAVSLLPRINLEIKSTVTPANYKQLKQLYLLCRKRGFTFLPKFAETRSYFYYNRAKNSAYPFAQFSAEQKKELLKVLRWILAVEKKAGSRVIDPRIIRTLIISLKQGSVNPGRCLAPLGSLFITSSGGIHPCLYKKPIANINSNTRKSGIFGKTHIRLIKEALLGNCPGCGAYHGYLKNINL
ncbi:MAG: radical SAM protein [Candidatus Omnitrophica bacterium]|nr:radical SAM protein [Candidatus Omnitrophota bacterium]